MIILRRRKKIKVGRKLTPYQEKLLSDMIEKKQQMLMTPMGRIKKY